MNFDDELSDEVTETGSDELLSDDNLRLPDSASTLVRLHAVRAWLTRRQVETNIEIGEAALALQQAFQEPAQEMRPRRRERQNNMESMQRVQQTLTEAQQRLKAYEEAQSLLEDIVSHTTSGERVLVEYYLMLEELLQNNVPQNAIEQQERTPWLQAIAEVQHRIEHVGTPNEEE